MNQLITISLLLLLSVSVMAQTKPESATVQTKPGSATLSDINSIITRVSGKQFMPDTVFAALSDDDKTLLAEEPIANWGLAQESGPYMTYYNLIVGTRSYQLLIAKPPKAQFPTATLLRFTTPKSKPEPIARGILKPKVEEKPK